MVTREDVIWCYSTFLNRAPESNEVVEEWRKRCRDFRDLARAFQESTEHQNLIIARSNSVPAHDPAEPAQGWIPYVPRPPFLRPATSEFLPFSMCVADDFMHPRFMEICDAIKHRFQFHRKLWEWVFVIHHLLKSGAVKKGARGLVFGVGAERLPAYFASLGASIVATDAPEEIGEANGWKATGQHSAELNALLHRDLIDESEFRARVSYEQCDMNHIPDHLTGFDFNWSSCCFEHLGDLEAGMDFVVNAVEKTLRIGGVAVHTTELNMSSDDETLASGHTVIYRHRDLKNLVERLRSRGHEVEELRVSPGSHPLDFHVDMPPYRHDPHIKLMYDRFVTTSVGIVVRRGA
ncbi:hypothetical protein [Burkholderia multivorans]|uniref:hypothetical protein n=1 Tax=Burkholderia multivorans TaxID=87883 RepID=UPI002018B41C|nr:hypothetical protein [Burkholderia multivorans]MCL4627499.1 hypothetical protein [Burkholderia multivorans]MCO1391004.1 hypothetical protein [Burkholderia multivorans]MDN7432460.1 hypothetical protein [Burkholderia multivorans]UQO14893.1 hypothetical protein L0Z40_20230 [Burkholderia multivorans]UQO53480.1 hypothetical protein L0Z30_06460 [Burkholderia multivorans]